MRYLVRMTYDGSKFYGFQRLNKKKTVQGELERVLTKINKTVVVVKGAGRTDRGVHAYDQCAHFDLSINIDESHLKEAMNSMLDDALRINDVKIVNDDFHARFDVKMKTYEYVINLGEYNPISNDYIYNYCYNLNVKAMKKASKYLLGPKSFESFTSGERDSFNSIINRIKFKKCGNLLYIRFNGKSFYRYMVRNMVGALMLVGQNKITPKEFEKLVLAKKNIYNYMTVPANGLYLISVDY